MPRVKGIAGGAAGILLILGLGAFQPPAALSSASPGMWEIAGAPGSKGAVRECVGDVLTLAQFEHRHKNCSRNIVSSASSTAVIHYSCGGSDFGESRVTVLTPRSMRIETQGISEQLPFNYVLQARRVGDCASAAAH